MIPRPGIPLVNRLWADSVKIISFWAQLTTLGCCIPAWDERNLRRSSRNNKVKSL